MVFSLNCGTEVTSLIEDQVLGSRRKMIFKHTLYKQRITVRLPSSMADRVKKIADSRGDGVSDIVREALEKYISTLKA